MGTLPGDRIKRKDFENMVFDKRLVLPFSLKAYHSPYYLIFLILSTTLFIALQSFQKELLPLIWVFIGIMVLALIGIVRRDRKRTFKTIHIPLKRKQFKMILPQIGHSLK